MAHPAYLVDASVWIFRAYFSIDPGMRAPDGRPVNALYGYASFLLELLRSEQPRFVGVAFDESLTSSFRNELFPAYKANRELPPPELEAQLALCRELSAALGLTQLASPRYEADDIIGTLAALERQRGRSCVVVTRDKDLTQVLRPGDQFWDLAGGRRLGYGQIQEAFGVVPERMADFLALTGDPVDNIPGVPGVGKKTAAVLLDAFDGLEALYAGLDKVQGLPLRGAARVVERLREHREAAFLARQLTAVSTDMPLQEVTLSRRRPQLDTLLPLLESCGLGRRLQRHARELAQRYDDADAGA